MDQLTTQQQAEPINHVIPVSDKEDFGTCFNCHAPDAEFTIQSHLPGSPTWTSVPYCRTCFADVALHMLNAREGFSCFVGSA